MVNQICDIFFEMVQKKCNCDLYLSDFDCFQCGEITEVRMVSNHSKQFRGFCYVEFKDKVSLQTLAFS